MSNEKLEIVEELFWEDDPPENNDEETEENGAAENEGDEQDPLAPLGEGDTRPTDADPG